MTRRAKAFLLTVALFVPWVGPAAQDISDELVDELAEEFEDGELAEAFQSLSIIGVAPGLSSAKFSIDGDEGDSDLEIGSVKLPISREFDESAFCFVRPDDGRYAEFDSPKNGFKPPSSRRKSQIKSAPEALYREKTVSTVILQPTGFSRWWLT